MANFQLDAEYIGAIKTLIRKNKDKKIKKQLHELHYADIAELIEALSIENAIYLVKLLDSEKQQTHLLKSMKTFVKKFSINFLPKKLLSR